MAAAATAASDWERATVLAAAAESLRLSVKAVWGRIGGRVQDQTVVAVRAALGEEDFQLAWSKGEGMTLAEAVVYALEEMSNR